MTEGNRATRQKIEEKKIRDFLVLKPYQGVYTMDHLAPDAIVKAFIFTVEARTNLQEILKELVKPPGSDRKSCLISGDRGLGKTHTLSLLRELVQDPTLTSLINEPLLREQIALLSTKKFMVVDIRCWPTEDENLKTLFYQAFEEAYSRYSSNPLPPMENWLELDDSDAQLKFIKDFIPPGHELLIFLDDISEKLITYQNLTKIIGDLEFILTIALATSIFPIFMVASFFEYLLSPPSGTNRYRDLNQKVIEYQIPKAMHVCHISKNNMLELVGRNIITKTSEQLNQIAGIHQYLQQTIPYFQHDLEFFQAIYPIHPLIFDLSFFLHRYIKNFSLMSFIYSSVNKILGYRCTALVTIDLIFDLLYYDFSKVPELRIALQSYETLLKETIPRLPSQERLQARMVLKAVFLFSIAEGGHPTPENIIDALLLSEYKGKPTTTDALVQLLDFFEINAPQCIRKIKLGERVEYQLVTLDHTSIDFIISELRGEDSALEEKVNRTLFQFFCQSTPSLKINKESYHFPLSAEPIEILWRGTLRRGIACWAARYDRVHVLPASKSEKPLLQELIEHLLSGWKPDWTKFSLAAELQTDIDISEDTSLHRYDWQLMVLPPGNDKNTISAHRELTKRYPSLIVLSPGKLNEEERRKIETCAILLAEENRYRFTEMENEYLSRRGLLEEEVGQLIAQKYFSEGQLMFQDQETTLNLHNNAEADFSGIITATVQGACEVLYPKHPHLGISHMDGDCLQQISQWFFSRNPASGNSIAPVLDQILLPMGLVKKVDGSLQFDPQDDQFLDSPFVIDIVALTSTFPAIEFPLSLFFRAFSISPYGLPKNFIDLILIAVVAAGKIKIFHSSRPDVNVLHRMSLTGGIDLAEFDSVQSIEGKVLPLPELMQWGYLLCNTQIEPTGNITWSRRHLKQLLAEWMEFQKSNSIESLVQRIPNELQTTALWRELQPCRRNIEAVENIVTSICSQHFSLEDGLTQLAQTFSNNIQAFSTVLTDHDNLKEFLEWCPEFVAAMHYIQTSEKTRDTNIENLRYDLTNLFDRPTRMIQNEKRHYFQKKFDEYKKLYCNHYLRTHDFQQSLLSADGELSQLMRSGFWKNLPTLSRLNYIDKRYLKTLNRLIGILSEKDCTLCNEEMLMHSPRCECGFRLTSNLNIESIIRRISAATDRVKTEITTFFSNYRKLIIRELQKIQSLDDSVARQVVTLINGDLDSEVGLGAIKMINFILKRKLAPLPMHSFFEDISGAAIARTDLMQNISHLLKELEESRETFFLIDGEET